MKQLDSQLRFRPRCQIQKQLHSAASSRHTFQCVFSIICYTRSILVDDASLPGEGGQGDSVAGVNGVKYPPSWPFSPLDCIPCLHSVDLLRDTPSRYRVILTIIAVLGAKATASPDSTPHT